MGRKRIVVKEEINFIAKGFFPGLILNQILYWGERTYDYNFFVEEEVENLRSPESNRREHGWIRKTAEEFAEELMTSLDKKTMRKYIKQLVELGLIEERRNPKDARDRTLQYRLNLNLIANTLAMTGDKLEHYVKYQKIINEKSIAGNIGFTKRNIELTRGISAPSKEKNSTTLLKSTSENIIESNINLNGASIDLGESIKIIGKIFLELSNRQRLTEKDTNAINSLLKHKYSTQKIIKLMEECFKNYPKTDKHKGITGFTFVKNYIEGKKGVVKDESKPDKPRTNDRNQKKGTTGQGIQSASISDDSGWVGDTLCDY